MMEKSQEIIKNVTEENWTTWEELLLACAVKRHGFTDWDTVAMEIKSRTSLPDEFITAKNCKIKYSELKRRFDGNATEVDDVFVTVDDDSVPWLEQLRNLRVAELRQEVHRYDDSILSLQLKVKRLEEERERSLRFDGVEDDKPDLENTDNKNRSENDIEESDDRSVKSSPAHTADKLIADEEIDRETESVNASNSTGLRDEIQISCVKIGDETCEPVNSEDKKPVPLSKPEIPAVENSVNDVKREISDVQSSASMMTRSRRNNGGAGEMPGNETVYGAMNEILEKTQPLFGVLELIRSHKRGSLFERRLEIQESDKYNNVIRQHMDLRSIEKRLEQGYYTSSTSKFYRDLFLLFNNAIIYFPKSSVESLAATELRNLIANTKMSKQSQRSYSSPEPSSSTPIQPESKSDPKRTEYLLAKDKSAVPIIVCRKRSSMPSKFNSTKSQPQSEEENAVIDKNPTLAKSYAHLVQEQSLLKIDNNDKIVTGTRSFRRSKSNLKNSVSASNGKSPVSDKNETLRTEKNMKEKEKEKETLSSTKKRGAVDFLKRIKGISPLETSKCSMNDSTNTQQNDSNGDDGGGERNRMRIEKNQARQDKVVLRSKQSVNKEISPSKRNVGRPPKKAVESTPIKRRREVEVSISKQPKKRSIR